MKRRSLVKGIAGLFAAPAIPISQTQLVDGINPAYLTAAYEDVAIFDQAAWDRIHSAMFTALARQPLFNYENGKYINLPRKYST
jgi:hypothetical protein